MITKIYTIEKLKSLIAELFYNKTTRITAASDESVINALFYGIAKVGQKAMKDISLVESHIFPQYAYGTYLDNAAELFGAPARLGVSGSSTYILLRANEGTIYQYTTNVFSGEDGISFELTEDCTIDSTGYAYAKVRSVETGARTNVNAQTIIKVNPIPSGHLGVVNEYAATGGRDVESDDDFRLRIIEHPNIIAQKTLVYLAEILRGSNEDVLRVINYGIDDDAKLTLAILLQNGADLTESELAALLDYLEPYLALSDLAPSGDNTGFKLVNPVWFAVGGDSINDTGIDFRVQILDNYSPTEVRKNIQIELSNYIDFRYFDWSQSIQWTDLLAIIKGVPGVRYVPDLYFNPQYDITVPLGQFPRIKKFTMKDLNGAVIFENVALVSVFYPVI